MIQRSLFRSHCLAAAVAVTFALQTPALAAFHIPVTNCNDSGPGSLRDAVANANNHYIDEDTIDMTGLTCSTISLTTGAILVNKASLILQGPGKDKLTIYGKYPNRVIDHIYPFNLTIQDLSISGGYLYAATGAAYGGCVLSQGNVKLDHVSVSNCKAVAKQGSAIGGGVYAHGQIVMNYSSVSASQSSTPSQYDADGGGIAAHGLYMYESTISGNRAEGNYGSGGGASIVGSAIVAYSTISGNHIAGNDGGIVVFDVDSTKLGSYSFSLFNSTVSGNDAGACTGGVYSDVSTFITNSTIVRNTAGAGHLSGGTLCSAGLGTEPLQGPITVYLLGVLAADNTFGPLHTESDFDASAFSGATLSADKNLIRAPSMSLPGSNLLGACPLIGPLRDNGGPTQTHALLSHSPAIDAGPTTPPDDFYDQRRAAYSRVSGASGSSDIGSYEVQQYEIIFNASFEGCPPLT